MPDPKLPNAKVLEFKCDLYYGQKYVVIGFFVMIVAHYILRELLHVEVRRGSWMKRKMSMTAQLILSFIIGIASMVVLGTLYHWFWKETALKLYKLEWTEALKKAMESKKDEH